jgi:hypothetical protein
MEHSYNCKSPVVHTGDYVSPIAYLAMMTAN